MPRLLTASRKQREFVHEYLKHGNQKKAYEDAYKYTGKRGSIKGGELMRNDMVQAYMKSILDKAGMTPDRIAAGLKAITEAGLEERALKTATPKDALAALKEAAKLADYYPAEKKQIEKKEMSLKLEGKSIKEMTQLLSDLAAEARTFKRLVEKTEDAQTVS